MEHEPADTALRGYTAVEGITGNGMADAIEMDADLVLSAGVGMGFDESERGAAAQNAELREAGFASLGIDGHPAGAETAERLIDFALVYIHNSMHYSEINL